MTNQELWETIKALRARIMGLERENRELKEQNKRHREALKLIREQGSWGLFTDKYAKIAHEALEGEE